MASVSTYLAMSLTQLLHFEGDHITMSNQFARYKFPLLFYLETTLLNLANSINGITSGNVTLYLN